MAALQIPYAILLGVMAFTLEFIPFLGVLISGAACVLVAGDEILTLLSVSYYPALDGNDHLQGARRHQNQAPPD